MLSAAGALQWFRDSLAPGVSFDQLVGEAEEWPAGAEGLTFLPYLAGERTPHADPSARAMFEGLSLRHGRGGLVRAVLEGVAYGLRDSLALLRGLGVDAQVGRASGGGARSRLWLEIVASVLGIPLELTEVEEGSAYGAALLAGVSERPLRERGGGRRGLRPCPRPGRAERDVEPRVRRGLCSLPRAVSGRQVSGGAMSYEPVKWGIMSTADINRLVIPPAQASEKVDLVAVASRTQERADEYAAKWGIPRAHGSYDALLADPEIEAVYISLPNTMHCEWSIRAAQAGKHVLCEKPMDSDPDKVDDAFDAADAAGTLLTEAFMWRHNPQTKRLQELLHDGSDRRAAARPLLLLLRALRRAEHPPAPRRRRRRADGRRLLLHQRLPARRGRARVGLRPAVDGAERDGLDLRGDAPLPGRRARRLRLRDGDDEPRRAGGDRQRGLAVPRRSVALPPAA